MTIKKIHAAGEVALHHGERLIRMKEVKALTGLGASTIYRLQAQGRFPKSLHPFGHSRFSAWRSTEVQQWISDRCNGKLA